MYYIKNKNELVGKTIKDAILGGVVNIGESWNANNNLIIVTEDNGVFVSCVQPDYVGDEEYSDNDSVFISPMPEDAFMRMLAGNDKVCLLKKTLHYRFKIPMDEIVEYAKKEIELKEAQMKKDKEDKEKERIKSATNLLRKERIDFRNRCKEKIHVGDMVEIANPTEILNNCKYAVLVEKGQDADFDEAVIDANSSHVFLVDSFKSIYNKKVKVLDIDSDGISIDVSDFPNKIADCNNFEFEFIKFCDIK